MSFTREFLFTPPNQEIANSITAKFTEILERPHPMSDQEAEDFYNFLGTHAYFFHPMDEKEDNALKPLIDIVLYHNRIMLPNPLFIRKHSFFDWFKPNPHLEKYFLVSEVGPSPTHLKVTPAVLNTSSQILKKGSIQFLTTK